MVTMEPKTLRERRVLFTFLLAHLVLYADHHGGWEVALGEGYVIPERKVDTHLGVLNAKDAVHRRGSLHYDGCAVDLLLYVNGQYITDSAHPAYAELGRYWLSLHPMCRWGGDWDEDGKPAEPGEHDANHFSLSNDKRG